MGRAIGIVRKCCFLVSRPLLRQIVQSLVLCHLDYCSTIWASAAGGDLRRLQVVQNRAARLVLNCPFRTNVDQLHACLSWLLLKIGYLLIFFYCSKRSCVVKPPCSFNHRLFLVTQCMVITLGLPVMGQLVLPRPKSNSLKRSFIYRSLSLWNDLPRHLCSINSKLTFKKHLRFHLIQ